MPSPSSAPPDGAKPVVVRRYTGADFDQLLRIQIECFPPPFPQHLLWSRAQIDSHVRHFSAGALAAEVDGQLVGSATCTRIRWDPQHPRHTWAEIADDGWIRNCDPRGDALYGIDVAVRPAWRGRGVARALYQARYALVRELGLGRFLAGSRISGYHRHAGRMSAQAYADAVVAGALVDPVITPQLRAGLRPVCLLPGYLNDAEAHDHALLMEWTP